MDAAAYILYTLIMAALIYLAGRIFPRKWIDYDSFPYCPLRCEKGGTVYEKLKIRKWKDKWPNASLLLHKICPRIPQKSVSSSASGQFLTLIHESCIAESTHCAAIAFGFLWLVHRRSRCTAALSVVNCLVNIPPIIIQRYNRPRYLSAYKASVRRESRHESGTSKICPSPE